MNLNEVSRFAKEAHEKVNCTYDGNNYYTHITMVESNLEKYKNIFKSYRDYEDSYAACSCHDLIEDAQLTFNDVAKATNKEVATIVLGVTDVHAENRLLRHLLTMGKTVKDYRAIIVKLCDMLANASYSKSSGSSMYGKYRLEYFYRRPIFTTALSWYEDKLNMLVVDELMSDLDMVHEYEKHLSF